ncbi:hypothetical protein [Pseudarthrobacter sp. fls2-241-R2A-168]|jgi:hypothetical protein|uniref:hypothetical protein n=1 Tax=Pseudarthrobacter sp. fls2-241-R2A-168 TaxID=3040304 RepID=UPI0025552D32|nr:hypothetical protein [Pseudarthrobacter sp. fls2-241-R2A-168]
MDLLHRFSRGQVKGQATESAQATHVLVQKDEYVFPLLLQERTVELPAAAAFSPLGKQELLKFLYHCGHLLFELAGPQNGRGN